MAEDVWSLLVNTFDYERRRCREQFEEICSTSSYNILELRDKGQLLGFIGFWSFEKWVAIEHIAVQKNENSAEVVPTLLNMIQKKYGHKIIVSEVDILMDEADAMYKQYYQLSGFNENPYVYIQPSYHKNCASFPKRIMSYPSLISYGEFKDLRTLLYNNVYGKKRAM